jgi:hypothetical protein
LQQQQHTPSRTHPTQHIGIPLTLTLKQFLAPDPLAVTAVPNLEPRGFPVRQVWSEFVLGDDAFEVILARQPEQAFAVRLDVVAEQEPLASLGCDRA